MKTADILERLEECAKEERDHFYENCAPVTNDSFVCLAEDAIEEIKKLRGALISISQVLEDQPSGVLGNNGNGEIEWCFRDEIVSNISKLLPPER